MENLSSNISPSEIPDGFSTADPTGAGPAPGGGNKQAEEAMRKQAQTQAILERALTPDALARLGTLKLVKAEKAKAVEGMIASMAMQGKLPGQINEGKLIEMLEGIGAKEKSGNSGKIQIQRKKYAFDSESEDDDDDLM
uniref:Programmed cell death protein 5 n=1 Tax=Attheya septentrionalis TaxID=420275 RepID=A0A7S2UGV7_9STRA|mmetsp:Transcript_24965/g.45198  ORF Transcript_24965/g.45198 Transcript_24965/m.45198 type:complete len:139 (+) Transcript_24965:109-525(+)